MPMAKKKLLARDSKRDIGAELLASSLEAKAGKFGRVHHVPASRITRTRMQRLCFSVPKPVADALRDRARLRKLPVSRYLAEIFTKVAGFNRTQFELSASKHKRFAEALDRPLPTESAAALKRLLNRKAPWDK